MCKIIQRVFSFFFLYFNYEFYQIASYKDATFLAPIGTKTNVNHEVCLVLVMITILLYQ